MKNIQWLCAFLLGVFGMAGVLMGASGGTDLSENMPSRDTPQKLVEAWLRFHETELCQTVDAVFVFDGRGLEVWYLYAREESSLKLEEIFKPLQDSYRVELYPTRRLEEKKSENDDEELPPSIYMNYDLRNRLGNVDYNSLDQLDPSSMEDPRIQALLASRDQALESRLILFARQILDQNQRAGRYATDLQLLAGTAFDAAIAPVLRAEAINVSKAHARNLGKCISRLKMWLKQALPDRGKKKRSSREGKTDKVAMNPVESAAQIAEAGQAVTERIHQFIYPEQHTVAADELRKPGILEDLNSLEKMVQDYQKTLSNALRSKDFSAVSDELPGSR